jgi:uncharacterized OB-fold protein
MSARPPAYEDRLAEAFFQWHEQGELRIQRCDDCGRYLHPPRVTCPGCHSRSLGWQLMSGNGTVFSWIVNHRAMTAETAALGVYVSALVQLAEGPRLLTRLLDVDPSEVVAGMPVTVAFEADTQGTLRAMFRPGATRA